MLIEFRASNYRSIREEVCLSMVASPDDTLQDSNVARSGIKNVPRLTRCAAVYGPNASGKSNLVLAIASMRAMVVNSATTVAPGQRFAHQPFGLDSAHRDQPTTFEATFVLNGVRHQYGFSFNSERVTQEWLLVYASARAQTWYHRSIKAEPPADEYAFSSHLKGSKEIWEKATRPNALFLSTAAQLNSEQLVPVYRWFAENLVVLDAGGEFTVDGTIHALQQPGPRDQVLKLMAAADFGISDVQLERRRGSRRKVEFRPDGIDTTREDAEFVVPKFQHASADGTALFELDQESLGTQRFFAFAGPLIDILASGKLLVVDELDSSLHTLLVRRIVDMFHTPALNEKGAQLVFTTHDTSLLDAYGALRRDQIWFTEKQATQATRLYPLTDFSPRKGEALERGYLSGRYGALPLLGTMQPG